MPAWLKDLFQVIAAVRNPANAASLQAIKAARYVSFTLQLTFRPSFSSSRVLVVPLDVTSELSIAGVAKQLKEEHKIAHLNVLINNAGDDDTDAFVRCQGHLPYSFSVRAVVPFGIARRRRRRDASLLVFRALLLVPRYRCSFLLSMPRCLLQGS